MTYSRRMSATATPVPSLPTQEDKIFTLREILNGLPACCGYGVNSSTSAMINGPCRGWVSLIEGEWRYAAGHYTDEHTSESLHVLAEGHGSWTSRPAPRLVVIKSGPIEALADLDVFSRCLAATQVAS